MPTLIEQEISDIRDITIPLAQVPPGEILSFPFVSLELELMRFLAKCAEDDGKSDIFIARAEDVQSREDGLVVVSNSALIPISSIRTGNFMVFQLKRKMDSPVSKIKVSHVLSH